MKVGGCFLCNKNQKLIMTYGEFMNNKIRALITAKFGRQTVFAQYVRHNESFVSKVLCGRVSPTPEVIRRWTEALGENVESLFENGAQTPSVAEPQKWGVAHANSEF